MKRSPITTALGTVIAAAVVTTETTGFATAPAPTPESTQLQTTSDVINESTSIGTMDIPESSGVEGTTKVRVVDALLERSVIDVVDTNGQTIAETVIVEVITVPTADSFIASVRTVTTGESTVIDTTKAQHQVIPVIIVARVSIGIKAALKIGTKAAIKEAAKASLIALGKNEWMPVMASKDNWSRLAKTKDEIPNLMSDAMANGTRSTTMRHVEFAWAHRGQPSVVRTSVDGHFSNGWIT